MDASSSSSSTALITPQTQASQQMYSSNPASVCVATNRSSQDDAAGLCACDTFCHSLQRDILPDFHHPADQVQQNSGGGSHSMCSHSAGGCDARDSISARKVHKADREKLRRDRLNEHFLELAGALDPDRPKNDKATILGDTIQAMRELSAEVKRLRTEHTSLSDESRDLAQEKSELQDEKALLKIGVERLQSQLQQHTHTMLSWMTLDPSVMMGAAAFPYPVPAPPHGSSEANARHPLAQGQVQLPFVAPSPYIPVPLPPGPLAVHPALQAYYRHGDGSNSYFPYPYCAPLVHTHVERPFAQIATPIQSLPGYPLQIHPNQVMPPISAHSQSASYYQPYPPVSFLPPQSHGQNPGSQQNSHSGAVSNLMHPFHPQFTHGCPATSGPFHQGDHERCQGSCQHVHTTLQLQTPSSCSPVEFQRPSEASGKLDHVEDPNHVSEASGESPSRQANNTGDCGGPGQERLEDMN